MKTSRLTQSAFLSVIATLALGTVAYAYTPITSQLDFGARGTNVTNLQVFFTDNSAIYPEGLVTGYFGGLTRSAVQRFQAQYGLDQVGRVGPMTQAKINSLIATGGWTTSDISGPGFYNVNVAKSVNSMTFTFNTNESSNARVVYHTSPLMFNEGDINSNGFGSIGGATVNSSNGLSTSHTITLSSLQGNTTYYYTVIVTDATGNVSVWGPNTALRTN